MKRLARLLVALLVLAWAAPALAGGYDTPMLYTARHMGMGGTAIGYVEDPSALFHNPAGLAQVRGVNLMGDFSLLLGVIKGSPSTEQRSIESNTVVAPFFLVGGAVGITDWLSAGIAVYPVASAGATYEYDNEDGDTITDKTRLVFIEVSPGVAVQLPYHLRIGVGYRINFTTLERERGGPEPAATDLSIDLSGSNFFSFRAGIQWQPIEQLELGVVYRHRTVTEVDGDAEAIGQEIPDVSTDFTLPGRFGLGARGNFGALHAAVDFEYALQSQNEEAKLTSPATDLPFVNVFEWQNAITLRGGVEYRLMQDRIAARLGYIFDGTTTNKQFPTAFGTPPAPTHVLTVGAGYDGGPWEANIAYAYRFGTAEVTQDDIDAGGEARRNADKEGCGLCGQAGDYAIRVHGIYVDFSYEFGGPRPAPAPAPDDDENLLRPEPTTSGADS